MKKDFIIPILVLSLICLSMSAALAFANHITAPIIQEASLVREYEAKKVIIPQAADFVLLETDDLPRYVNAVFATSNNVGYIIITTAVGYGGDIRVICGISPEGYIIKSRVASHTETQGLGTIVFEKATIYEGKDKNLWGVDAIAGSTITSNAYKRAIQDAFIAFEIVREAR